MKNCPRACALLVVGAVALVSGDPLELQGQALSQLAIVGGMLIDGHEGVPIQNSVILVDGDRITHVGTVSDTEIPSTARVIDANGLTVMPGLNEAHAHLIVVGHGFYDEYFPRYMGRWREIMEISARQLLMAGVTTARDLGAPLEDAIWVRDEINAGRMVGPRLFVSGPFLQKSLPVPVGTRYDYRTQAFVRWTVDGPEDAARKARQLIDAGVDVIKVIQLGQLTREERMAIVDEAHRAGLHMAVHAGSVEEVRAAAEMGVGSIEHMGGGRNPLYPEESLRLIAENRIVASVTSLVSRVYDITAEYPERLDNPQLKSDLPADIYEDVRAFAGPLQRAQLLLRRQGSQQASSRQGQAAVRARGPPRYRHGLGNSHELPLRVHLAGDGPFRPVRHSAHEGHQHGDPPPRAALR